MLISLRKYGALFHHTYWSKYPQTFEAIIENLDPILAKLTIKDCLKLIEIHQQCYLQGKAEGLNMK